MAPIFPIGKVSLNERVGVFMATGDNEGREYPDSICFGRSDDAFFSISIHAPREKAQSTSLNSF